MLNTFSNVHFASKMKLVIFDLDHTLVNIFRLHDRALHYSMQKVFGIKTCFNEIDFTGKKISTSMAALCKLHKTPATKHQIARALKAYEQFFIKNLPKNTNPYVLKGAKPLLKKLSTKHFLALVTADIKTIAQQVMKRAGLDNHFKVKIYADDGATRAGLVKKAIRLAKQKGFKGKDVVVIGDSPRDIQAGRANKAITIGVATGTHSVAQLKKAKAHYAFKNLHSKKIGEAL